MLIAPIELGTGAAFEAELPRLRAALAGDGPLLVPYAPGAPPPLLPERAEGLPDDAAFALGTSGSTGTPKLAVLSAAALRASAQATHETLGGPGQWVAALPPHHIAGLQILLRALAGGHAPVPISTEGSFGPGHLIAALDRARREAPRARRYTSLVPTQLVRLLDSADGVRALRGFQAILVGGAATARPILDRAREVGARVITTYGMSETCGGCVYDGRPIGRIEVEFEDGRVLLGGAPVAHGYLHVPGDGSPARLTDRGVFSTDRGGTRWFRTDDLGHGEGDRLVLDGRADDVINTGGLKVLPGVVERALAPLLPAGTSVLVVGVPDPEWGEVVGAVAVPASPEGAEGTAGTEGTEGTEGTAGTDALRDALPRALERLRDELPGHALPRRWDVLPTMPLRGPGKPDRRGIRDHLAGS